MESTLWERLRWKSSANTTRFASNGAGRRGALSLWGMGLCFVLHAGVRGQVPQAYGHLRPLSLPQGDPGAWEWGSERSLDCVKHSDCTLTPTTCHHDPLATRGGHGAASLGIAGRVSSEASGSPVKQCGWDVAPEHLPCVGLTQRIQATARPEGLQEAPSTLPQPVPTASSGLMPSCLLRPFQRPPTNPNSSQAPTTHQPCAGLTHRK